MTPVNWREPDEYIYTRELSREHWAWEFLRRNPAYRQDWDEFWAAWQALEADYGSPPNRDFQRWKQDPRAYVRDEACREIDRDEVGIGCAGEQGKILIECWMGAKWGFYKFPLSPDRFMPKVPEELLWREIDTDAVKVTDEDPEYLVGANGRIALGFDLTLPLKDQIEEARQFLATEQRRLAKAGELPPRTVKACVVDWTLSLRILDAEAEGVSEDAIREAILPLPGDQPRFQKLRDWAHRFRDGGYRRILLMSQG